MSSRMPALLKATLVPIGLSATMAALPGDAWAEGDDGLITQFCLASFNSAMAHAGQSPPDGMGSYTCRCFLDEVKSGASIDAAQTTCKSKAASIYKL